MILFLKNKKFVLLSLGLVLALGIFIIWSSFYSDSNSSESSDRLGKVTRDTLIQRVTIAGTVESARNTLITASYDGYIKKLFVSLGDDVKLDQALVSIVQSMQSLEPVFPVRAPFSGRVTQVLLREGQAVKQGDAKEFVMRLDDFSSMHIHAEAPEIEITKIKPGLEAIVKVSAILSRSYKAHVKEISQSAISREGWGRRTQVSYSVKLEFLDPDAQLKPGMSTILDIITNKRDNVLVLAHEFIQKENDQFFVLLKNGKRKNIKVGIQNEQLFEIVEGLTENEEVKQVDFLQTPEGSF